jgi:predicted adenylyl cyclase CyaB
MKYELEVSVRYLGSKEEILEELRNKGFKIQEEFELNDIYMVNKDLDISKISNLDLLSKSVIVREIVGKEKLLLYKYKEFNENGDIIKQGKVRCNILDIEKGKEFLEALNFRILFEIRDKNYIYTNGKNEIYVQDVEGQGIYIEMEQENIELDNLNGNNINEMKDILISYNFNIDKSNFFVKKAEVALMKIK